MDMPMSRSLATDSGSCPHPVPPGAAVLVVDDETEVAESLAFLLRANGFDVTVALDRGEGRSAMAQRRFDVVITDLDMPGNSRGWLAGLRADNPDACLIVMTGLEPSGAAYTDLHQLADAVFLKPHDGEELLRTLRGGPPPAWS